MTEPVVQTVFVSLGGRDIEMSKPTEGALLVLARVSRALPTKIENDDEMADALRERLIRNLGTLGKVVEGMLVNDDDKSWLDDAMIDGDVSAEDVFDAIRVAGEKFNGAVKPKAAAPVRRRR